MSTTIDQRVVEMRFDNKQFERNVSTTMSSLDKLKQSLNLNGAAKGLEDISSAANKVDMSGLGGAVDSVKVKFSALQVMAVTALSNITNSAFNAGKRIASALTIDPIKTGFNEYETKMNAIQTIMSNTASKGTMMDDVIKVIDELNTYADKTIYNFSEMTRNIGTFTAAGVGLEDSAVAIQGIANLAAASGSSSQQASTAMYQLSQALASGTVKLQDWNSVVNAGMGGEKFQEALKATAREHGIAVDKIVEDNGSFRDSLKDGWLSADILNETLKKFTVEGAEEYAKSMVESGKYTQDQADALIKEAQAMEDAATKVKTFTQLWDTLKEAAQSGWGKTWEIIIGDFEEAKETLTKFSDVIGGMINASADARNELLQGWKDEGGRAALLESVYNAFEGIMSIITPIKEAFREIFPPITVQQLVGFTEGLKNLTSKLKISSDTANKLKKTFAGLFAGIDIVLHVIKQLASGIFNLVSGLDGFGNGILDVTSSFGEWLLDLRDSIKSSNSLGEAIGGVTNFLQKLINKIGEFMSSGFSKIGPMFSGIWEILKKIGNKISEVFSHIGKALSGGGDFDFNNIVNLFNAGLFAGILLSIKKFIKNFDSKTSEIFNSLSKFVDNIVGILDGVKDSLKAWQKELKSMAILNIAIAVGILAASILILSTIDSDKIASSISAITILFSELALMSKLMGAAKIRGATSNIATLVGLSASILILSSALKNISSLNIDEIERGIIGIAGLASVMVASAKILSSGSKSIMKGATGLIAFAASIKILALACTDLASLKWEELAKGLVGVGVLMASVVAFTKTVKTGNKLFSTAVSITVLGAALKILANVCSDFASMSWEEIAKGLVSVGVLLGEISAFTKLTGDTKKIISASISLTILGAAMKIMASVLADMGSLSWESISKGLLGVATSLFSMALAVRMLPEKDLWSVSAVFPALAAAMIQMSIAFEKVGKLSILDLTKGVVSMGLTMIMLSKCLKSMSNKDVIKGSAALMIAAVALLAITPVLMGIGSMGIDGVVSSLIGLAGVFVILGVATKLLKPLIPSILGLSVSIIALGASFVALGAGMAVIGVGLTSIMSSFVVTILSLKNLNLADIGKGLLAVAGVFTILGVSAALLKPLIPTILQLSISVGLLGLSCVAIAAAISIVMAALSTLAMAGDEGASQIVSSFKILFVGLIESVDAGLASVLTLIKNFIIGIVDVVKECAPAIVDGLLVMILEILNSLHSNAPQIVDVLISIIVDIINKLAERIPDLFGAIGNLIGSIVGCIIDALNNLDGENLLKGITAFGLITGLIYALSSVSKFIPGAMKGVIGVGVVIAELSVVLAAIGAIAQIPGLSWLINEGGKLLEDIGNAIGSFIGGLVGGVMSGVSSQLPKIGNDLSEFMENADGFIEGAKKIDPSMLDGVMALTGVILALTAANILEGIASWLTGSSSITKFSEELPSLGTGLKKFSDEVAGIDPESILAASSAAKALAEMTSCIPNEGGVVGWFTGENSIAKFGTELVDLGKGLKAFASEVKGVDPETIIAASNAAKALAEMTSCIPNEGGVVGWFTGENSISKFSTELTDLGKGLKAFSNTTEGVDPAAIIEASSAAKALAEMTNCIPNEGGIVSWFTGENSISKFGTDLVSLGKGLKGFSDEIRGTDPTTITSAAAAAKALAEMTNCIPNEGGVVSWFTGENSIAKFSKELVDLGTGLNGFAASIEGVDTTAIISASNAAKALAEMTGCIPNSDGVVQWFAGEKSISKFGTQLVDLGKGLKGFSDAVIGMDPETVTVASTAAKSLAEMTSYIPNEGGVVGWFTGENSIAKFSSELSLLGSGLCAFSHNVEGLNVENVTVAVNAAKSLAEMTSCIPNSDGVVQWFTGEQSISKFSSQLASLGLGLYDFSYYTNGINSENVTAAANAAKTIAEMTNCIPSSDGVAQWFTGEQSISKFGNELGKLGLGLYNFSYFTNGINSENISVAANAAKTLAEMTKCLPSSDGMAQWFTGEQSVSKFSGELGRLGLGLYDFSYFTNGINSENVTAAANAAKAIAEMTNCIPSSDGVAQWFTGEKSIAKFGTELVDLGKGLKGFSDSLTGVNADNMAAGANTAKTIASITEYIPDNIDRIPKFGEAIEAFAASLKLFYIRIGDVNYATLAIATRAIGVVKKFGSDINATKVTEASIAVLKLIRAANGMADIKSNFADGFISVLNKLGEANVDAFVKAFKNVSDDMAKAGRDSITKFVDGVNSQGSKINAAGRKSIDYLVGGIHHSRTIINRAGQETLGKFVDGAQSQLSKAKNSFSSMAYACAIATKREYTDFYKAGKYLVEGFANGISANTFKAKAQASAMAELALKAAKEVLRIASPSKETYIVGKYFGMGFTNAVDDYGAKVYDSAYNMADYARNGLSKAVSKIRNIIDSDMDTQPTIRPIIDLSSVESGVGRINGMFGLNPSVGVLSNVGSINSMMNQRIQNGNSEDVVSAIHELGKQLGSASGDSYYIDGITYDDGSNISNAVKSLVRAARVERRR